MKFGISYCNPLFKETYIQVKYNPLYNCVDFQIDHTLTNNQVMIIIYLKLKNKRSSNWQ